MRIRAAKVLPDGRLVRGRFDALTILVHWLTVAAVLFLFASGWGFDLVEGTVLFKPLLMLHRSTGAALWALTLLRFLWRKSFATFPPFPANLSRLMELAAKASEYGLYLLLMLQPLTGLADTLLRGRPFDLLGYSVPALLPRLLDIAGRFHELHEWGAWGLAGLAGTHALAALFHHAVLRDDVLEAMLPLARRRAGIATAKEPAAKQPAAKEAAA